MQPVGERDGVRIYDDYGHHPTEIAATLQAARDLAGKGRLLVGPWGLPMSWGRTCPSSSRR